jgi:uncharacterized protein (DUF58 family)
MTRAATPKLAGYTGLSALALFLGLALRLPELVAIGAPFALVVASALLLDRQPQVDVDVALDRDRVLEDDEVALRLDVRATTPAEIYVALARDLHAHEPNPFAVRGDDERTIRITATRWGAYVPGRVFVRVYDRLRMLRYETQLDRRLPLKVYPRAETVRALPRPFETQVFSGNQVARTKGDGIEFADLRQFSPGDLVRRVNWRASARRGQLWVNEYHPERNADVILFLDSFAEARDARRSTLDQMVRAASSLASHYLREKDRVGLISFGGVLNWLLPSTGIAQRYRIVDSLLDSRIILNYAWRNLDVIPQRTLPPQALVLALSPLLDERATDALLDLRARRFDVAVIEISPLPFVEPGRGDSDRIAHRLWSLKRDALRARCERAGIPIAVWSEEGTLAGALEEVRSYRRYARTGR